MSIMFSTDGEGHWWRREWKPQCKERVFLAGKCQGVEGHKGDHWCYEPSGSYAWSNNDAEKKLEPHDAAAGSTPPDHRSYISPAKKAKDHYLNFYEDSEVTDPAEIERLEKGKIKEGESITGPCSRKEVERLKKEGRLPPDAELLD